MSINTIRGTTGNDTLTGTSSADSIIGDRGNDIIDGAGGNDVIDAGDGADVVSGGAGDDTLRGGRGIDLFKFQAGDGKDIIGDLAAGETVEIRGYGAAQSITQVGRSVVMVLSGGDHITFQNSSVASVQAAVHFFDAPAPGVIDGTESADELNGTNGADTINGLGGDDTIYGLDGNDSINGGAGDDSLFGGNGSDQVAGGDGNDSLTGSDFSDDHAADTLSGGDGDDSFGYYFGDSVDGGLGTDVLNFNAFGIASGISVDFRELTSGGTIAVGGGTITGIEYVGQLSLTDGKDVVIAGAVQGGHGIYIDGFGGDDDLTGSSGVDFIHGGDGNDIIRGGIGYDPATSAHTDSLYGEGGDDTFYSGVDGAVAYGGLGNDTFNGGEASDQFYGDAGDDTLVGGGAGDYLHGGDGFDVLDGGAGSDSLTGGAGADVFKFESGGGFDAIFDLAADDKVEISGYTSGQLNQLSFSEFVLILSDTDHITFENTTAAIIEAALNIQIVPAGPTSGNDNLLGTPGNDAIDGLAGADMIKGLAGNDTLSGGADNDLVYGGDGADVVDGGSGDDFVASGDISDDGLEHDVVSGGDGNDQVSVAYGDDADGGTGTDWLRFNLTHASAGVTFDMSVLTSGQQLVIGGATLQNFERLATLDGSAFNDTITLANQSGAYVYGGGGNDTITVSGNSTDLEGADGNDVISVTGNSAFVDGGNGDDVITVIGDGAIVNAGGGDNIIILKGTANFVLNEGGNDTIDYRLATTGVIVDLSKSTQANGDQLSGISNANGSAFADTLTGSAGNNLLSGAAGGDTLEGGAGNDTLTGGADLDTFVFRAGDGSDTISDFGVGESINVHGYASAQSVTQVGGDVIVAFASGDQITVSNSTTSIVNSALHFVDGGPPQGDVTLTGTGGADILTGGAGDDTLNGLGGNDMLDGGAGADAMNGGVGNDVYYVENGGDAVTELSGQGTDTVHSTIGYTLGANVENGVLDGTAAADLTGNTLANMLTGNDSDNFLYGLGGNDTLVGGGGSDTLRGGVGADTLTGGAGADLFVFENGGGNDKVTDFVSGTDKIDLHLLGITSADIKTVLSAGNTVISVDADHNGKADFTITLVGVSHVASGDYIFA